MTMPQVLRPCRAQSGRRMQIGQELVPPRRLERPTNGLGRRTKMKTQLIDLLLIGESMLVCSPFGLSIQFPFISREPYTPDL